MKPWGMLVEDESDVDGTRERREEDLQMRWVRYLGIVGSCCICTQHDV